MSRCADRVALVTGASRGIGRAIARRLAAEGAAVVLSASRPGAHGELAGTLAGAAAEIVAAGGRAAPVVADLVSEEERADLVFRAEAVFGPLDILVNNAAMGRWALPSAARLSDRRKMMEGSRPFLHAISRTVRSLDGSRVLGDAFLAADPGAVIE
jgi:citronellol/citronellal dehydrogenase